MDDRNQKVVVSDDEDVIVRHKPRPRKDSRRMRQVGRLQRKNWMRNRSCPCGSGAKFKKCCWHKWGKS